MTRRSGRFRASTKRRTSEPSRHTARRIVGVTALFLGLTPIAIDHGPTGAPAAAEIIAGFTPPAFTTNAPGAIDIVGNGLMTCPPSATCTDTLAGDNGLSNNNYSMIWNDSDDGVLPAAISAQTSTSSSFANVSLPSGSDVLYASLHWSALSNSASRNQIDFYVPGSAGYQTVTGAVDASGSLYQASADVTALVQGAGSGDYWAGDVRGTTGGGQYAGWSLVVVYENPGLPVRNLTVFDGLGRVRSNESIDVPVSGFLTPPFGPVNAEIGVVAYEGDRLYTGDQLLIDADGGSVASGMVNLSDASNPVTNFGNNSISDAGVPTGPGGVINNLNIDIDEFATTDLLQNAQTNSTVRFRTTGDWWYPGVLTFAVDLFVPEFPDAIKTVTDLNGGDAVPGDVLEYSMATSNIGNDAAISTTLTDVVPSGTTFVPGSISVDGVAQTDAANTGPTDLADFTGTSIVARLGTGATGTTGGVLLPGESAEVTFRVTIDEVASGTTIVNSATIDYTADTLGEAFTFATNEVETPVPPRADLSIVKSGAPDPAVPGDDVTWTITITNDGPNTATGVTLDDTLGNNTFVSATGATCSGSTSVSCSVPDIAAGASATVTIVGATDPALASTATVSDTATVSSAEDDPDPSDNATSASLPVEPRADLSIAKSDDVDPVTPNATLVYTLTVTNAGPSVATDVVIADALPGGVTPVSVSSPDTAACSLAARTCTVPSLAVGASATMEVAVTVDTATAGDLSNAASVRSDAVDPDLGDNSVTEDTTVTAIADIGVDKTTLDAPLVAGETVSYRIRVTNAGPSTAASVVVTDTIAPELDLISVAPAQGSCSGDPAVSCALGPIGAGGVVDVIVTAMVEPSASGVSITNTATATTTTDEPIGGDANTDSVTDVVGNASDLRMIKTVDQNPLVAGGTFEYTLTVVNDGPSDSSGTITVTDAVPDPLVPDTVSTGCSIGAGDVVTCTSTDSLPVGDSITFTVSGTVPPAAAVPTASNSATVGYTGTDPNPANDTATADTDLVAEADLSIDKEWTAATATAGSTAEFTLTVTNDGPSIATDVELTDALPAGVSVVSASGTGLSCNGSTTVVCAADAPLASGGSLTATVVVDLAATLAAGQLDNTASVASTTDDRNPSNNIDVDAIDIVREADLAVTKSADDTTPAAGETVTYTVVVTNAGPSTANATFVGDPLPAGLTLTGAPATTQGSCVDNAGTITCELGDTAVGGVVTITYSAVVDPSVPPGTDLVNTVTATSTDPDPTPATADETVTTVGEADLVVTKTASADPAVPGGPLAYTVVIANAGPSDARDVVLDDPPPAGFTVTSASTTVGSCDLTVSCAIGTIPVGSEVTVTIGGTVASDYADATLTNTTDPVSSSTDLVDTADDAGSVTVAIAPQADLFLTKAASPGTVAAGGGLVTYTIAVGNRGPSDAEAVEVADVLPPGFVVDTVTPSQGSCSSASSCELGTLAAGDPPATISVVGHYPSTEAAGTRTNTASATSSTPLADTADDTDTAEVDVTTAADVGVSKTGDIEAMAGTAVRYQIAVTNDGPSTAADVTLADVLDAGLLDATGATVAVSPASAGTCANVGGTITCSFGDVAVGELILVTVDADVLPDAPAGDGNLENTATVDTSTADPTTANDSSTLATDIVRSSDVAIVKTGPADFVAGEPAEYTLTVTNNGPSDASGVVVDDPVPAGVTFGAVTSTPDVCDSLPCPIGDLAVGETVVITISATVDAASTTTSVENTATVASSTNDGNPPNNASTLVTPVGADADMELVSKTDDADPVAAGSVVTYTITAANNGPSTAVDAVIVDTVPATTTLVAASLPPGCTTTGVTPGSTITCDLGDLASGASVERVIQFVVDADAAPPTQIANTATASSSTADGDPSNDAGTETTDIAVIADLGITKAADLATAVPGEALTYTLTVTNAGPSTIVDVTVADDVSGIFDAGTVSTTPIGAPGGTVCDSTIECDVPTFPVGSFEVEVTGIVAADITTALNNVATVAAATPSEGADALSNTATLATPVAPSADLGVAKSATPALLVPDAPVTYTITVTNAGPSDAADVVVGDSLPTEITPAAPTAIATAAPGAVCDQGALTCTIPSIAAGDSVTITVDGTVGDRAVDSVDNTATIVSSATPDPDPTDDTVTISTPVAPRAGVAITKTTVTDPVVAGEIVRWTVTVVNAGPATAENVVVTDTLPAGVTYVNASPAVGACTHDGSPTGGVLTCDLGDLGDQATVTIVVDALVGPTATGAIGNSATVSTDTVDPDPADDTASTSDPVVTAPDLRVDKVLVPGDPATPDLTAGEEFEYRITVTNDGPSTALADIVLADTLPAQVSDADPAEPTPRAVVLSDTTNCSYDDATNAIDCTFADDLAVGDSIVLTVTGFVRADAVTVDDNTASVTTADADPDTSNNTSTAEADLVTNADLETSKVFDDASVVAGETTTFTITTTNRGPSQAVDVTLTDDLPAGWTVDSIGPVSGAVCAPAGSSVTCSSPTLPVGATITAEITALVAADHPAGPVANTATATSATPDRNPDNDDDVDTIAVTRLAGLTIDKVASSTDAIAGTEITYTVTVTSDGPSSAELATVGDPLPADVDLVPGTIAIDGSAPVAPQTCAAPGDVLVCDLGTMAPGDSHVVTYTVEVRPDVADGTTIVNTATAETITPLDAPAVDDSDVDITTEADVELVSKTVDPNPLVAGDTAIYTITVGNNGPSIARDTTVVDALPATLTPVAGSLPAECSVVNGNDVSCTVGTLDVGETMAIDIEVTVDASVADGASITNAASVSADEVDPVAGNDTGSVTAPVVAVADVSISKSATPDPVVPGEDVTYTIVVTNDGPSVARDVTVADPAPAGVTFTAVDDARCDLTASCTLGDLPVGSTTIVLTGAIAADVTTPIENTATVATDTDEGVDAGPNSSSVTSAIATVADLSIAKTISPVPPVPGDDLTYTITVTNPGPSAAQNVVVSDSIDPAVTGLATTTPGCSLSGSDLTCSVAALAPGTFTATVTGTLDEAFVGDLTNTATVTTDTPQGPNTAADSATVTETAAPSADLVVTKTADPDPVIAGEPLGYTISVTNDGPSTAVDVVVTDTLPDGFELTGVSSSQGACNDLPCSLGDLADGATATVMVDGVVDPDVTDLDANVASASSSTPDPDAANNTGTADPVVDTSADLGVDKELTLPADGTAVPGEPVQWRITVTNDGPSDAQDVVVTDAVPAGIGSIAVSSTPPGCVALPCTFDTVAAGASAVVTVDGVLDADVTDATVTNTASVSSSTAEADPADDSASVVSPIVASADLRIEKTGPPAVTPGAEFSYTLTVENDGPSDAADLVVVDTLPPAFDPATVVVSADDAVCTTVGSSVECTQGVLASGAATSVTITASVLADFDGDTVVNTASVSASTSDPDLDDNASTATSDVAPVSDLVVAKSGPVSAVAGGSIGWEIVVLNDGPSAAPLVVVTDTLPDGVVPASVAIDGGTSTCTLVDLAITCEQPILAVGDSFTITIDADLDADLTVPSIANTATASSANPDDVADDNSATAVTSVESDTGLSAAKQADVTRIGIGEEVTYTIEVTNSGSSTAFGVVVSDELPAGLTATSATSDGGGCSAADGAEVTCDPVDLAPGATVTVTIVAIATDAGATTNVATVDCDCRDQPIETNAVAVVVDEPDVDLVLDKTASAAVISPGNDVAFTIVVANRGTDAAADVVIDELMPDGLTVISSSATQGTFDVATSQWTVGTLAAGASETLTVVTTASANGVYANSVQVSSGVGSVPADTTATATVTVRSPQPIPTTGTSLTGDLLRSALALAIVGAVLRLVAIRRRPGVI